MAQGKAGTAAKRYAIAAERVPKWGGALHSGLGGCAGEGGAAGAGRGAVAGGVRVWVDGGGSGGGVGAVGVAGGGPLDFRSHQYGR